jgi:hypothetical protein
LATAGGAKAGPSHRGAVAKQGSLNTARPAGGSYKGRACVLISSIYNIHVGLTIKPIKVPRLGYIMLVLTTKG